MNVLATFRPGETIRVALDAVSGNVADVTSVTAKMRAGEANSLSVFRLDSTKTPIDLVVTSRVASGNIPAGWDLTLAAASTGTLTEGPYAIDAKLTYSTGEIDITEPSAIIMVTKAAVS